MAALPDFDDHEQVVFCSEESAGLRAVIALHDTRLGPAIGGCRMWAYADETAAVVDALRLSRAMTYKAAMAGLDLGGGKSVIMGNPRRAKTPELLQAMGRAVNRLCGRYITSEDVGTSVADMSEIRKATRYVVGLSETEGGSGDPSATTAEGTVIGIRAAVGHAFATTDLRDARIAVQGLGDVGWHVADSLARQGAELIVSDTIPERIERAVVEFRASVAEPGRIYDEPMDVFVPCALGGIIDDSTVNRLKARVIAGAANNQCARDCHAQALQDRGILFAPDYIINAAGLIRVDSERRGFDPEWVEQKVRSIGKTLKQVFLAAEQWNVSTLEAAQRLALKRLTSHK
ncbi:Leu/Phe/Val dehydrogenase [Hoeflea poritis]|uniref:Amino acid dehydrogenase n=1 Tax=Hoeflea poritis TaxID=2993659 RepID=A0ABT4VK93_9HYPH|nr:Glu/Leu/Phe/Val dehydrogenase dimerization domain-containing protein [Hoeflea poritis]MDA4845127.1 amino acid dehydrogenase [Hoeflea poritis]